MVAALLSDPDFAAACGENLYPDMIPQTAVPPSVAYSLISSSHDATLAGALGMQTATVRYEIVSTLAGDCETIKEIIRNRLQGVIGSMSGLIMCYSAFETEFDGYYEPLPGSDLGTHYKRFDLRFKWRESLPSNLPASIGA
jgi:hypothetical protein